MARQPTTSRTKAAAATSQRAPARRAKAKPAGKPATKRGGATSGQAAKAKRSVAAKAPAKAPRRAAAKPPAKSARAVAAKRKPAPAKRPRAAERRQAEPQSLRLRALSASLTADDLGRSLAFYEAIGFVVKERWEENGKLLGVSLLAGACELGLSQDDGAKGTGRQKGVGFRLWAQTTQDLDAIAARARQGGVEGDGPKEEWGTRSLTFTDPDGFRLTLLTE